MLARVTALMGIKTRLKLARLVFVTGADAEVERLVAAACLGGADAVELKDPSLSRAATRTALTAIRATAQARQQLIVLHGDARVGGEAGVDALVLGDDADARAARAALSPWAVVGRSCNSADEVDAALADDAVDFLIVGPGLDHVKHAAAQAPADDPASKPWFAAGGITERTLDIVLRAGALRIAVGRGIRAAEDPERAARRFADRLRAAWADNPRMDAVIDAAFDDQPKVDIPPANSHPAPTDLTI